MRFPRSDHCDGQRFFNPHAVSGRSFAEVIAWQRTRQREAWPDRVALEAHPPPPSSVPFGRVAVTHIGHATFLLRTADAVILTDPVFTSHAGPLGRLGPRRVRPPALAIDALPPLDLVIASHNHYDHFQPSSLRAVAKKGRPEVATSLGLGSLLSRSGFPRPVELDWWQGATVGSTEVTCVPAQHFSARTPWDKNRSLWSGFVLRSGGVTIYFAGDTGYGPMFGEIGRRMPGIDVALVPIGAYEPRWFMKPMHVNPEEAVRIHLDVRPRVSVAMHFGTFPLTDEAIDAPLGALAAAREAHHLSSDDFRTIDFGETALL
jgi:L-ascorbate metabolism protein UlaG (beta-lactamase superfamily)